MDITKSIFDIFAHHTQIPIPLASQILKQ